MAPGPAQGQGGGAAASSSSSQPSSLNLSQDDLKALDSVRGRLVQLSSSIASLRADAYKNQPLPSPDSLQASAAILQQNLASLLHVMAQHADLFQRLVVHPASNFPGRTQEAVLLQLLRKKLEPDLETAVERAREAALARGVGPGSFVAAGSTAAGAGGGQAGGRGGGGVGRRQRGGAEDSDEDEDEEGYAEGEDDDEDDDEDDEDDEDEDDYDNSQAGGGGGGNGGGGSRKRPREPAPLGDVWAEAREWCIERVDRFIRDEAPDLYTREERAAGVENVRTGLRRNLEEDEDEDEEDEEDESEEDEEEEEEEGGDEVQIVSVGGAPQPRLKMQTQQAQQQQVQQQKAPVPVPVPRGAEPELLMWFSCRGDTNMPPYIELESRKAAAVAAGVKKR